MCTMPHPSSQGVCNECDCLFNHNCSTNDCIDVPVTLGFNCSRPDGPVEYIMQVSNGTSDGTVNVQRCALERICRCLSRNIKDEQLERLCHELCIQPDASDVTSMPTMETLYSNHSVCAKVNKQYCRRYREKDRPTECARTCVKEASCVRGHIYNTQMTVSCLQDSVCSILIAQ